MFLIKKKWSSSLIGYRYCFTPISDYNGKLLLSLLSEGNSVEILFNNLVLEILTFCHDFTIIIGVSFTNRISVETLADSTENIE